MRFTALSWKALSRNTQVNCRLHSVFLIALVLANLLTDSAHTGFFSYTVLGAVQCSAVSLLIMREYKVQGPVQCSAFIDTWDSIQCWVQCSAVPLLIMRQYKVLCAVQCTVPSVIHETVHNDGCSAVHSAISDTRDSIQCKVPSVIHETPNNPVTCQEHIYSY